MREDRSPRQSDLSDPRAGARNLLVGCVGLSVGERLLIMREEGPGGFYDPAVSEYIAEEARRLGADVQLCPAPAADGPETALEGLMVAMTGADHIVFLSPIGDRLRFRQIPGEGSKTMCYALDLALLGADFCRVPYALMHQVHDHLVAVLAETRRWCITCPLGTDVTGEMIPLASSPPGAVGSDGALTFTLTLFPVMIFPPLSCAAMTGRVVLSRWLTTTATHDYEDDVVPLDAPVTALIDRGRITGFEGPAEVVRKVTEHYARVGGRFDVDSSAVGSWHTGINPRTFYAGRADDNLARWGIVAFGSPRYTHFHTCGDTPGEICWSLFDTTISFDGTSYWRDGRFVFLDRPEVRALLSTYPGAERAFEMRWDIGL
jgi:hypothetical protein